MLSGQLTQHEDQELWARYDKFAILHTWSQKVDIAHQEDINLKQLKEMGGEGEMEGRTKVNTPSELSTLQTDSSKDNNSIAITSSSECMHTTTARTSLCGRLCMMCINLMKTLEDSSCSGLYTSLGSSSERMRPEVRGVMIWKALDWEGKGRGECTGMRR